MDKYLIVTGLFLYFAFMLYMVYIASMMVKQKNIEIMINESIRIEDKIVVRTYTQIDRIQEIALNVSKSHEYIFGKFMCSDFAKALHEELTNNNFSSAIATGTVNCSTGLWDADMCSKNNAHSWVIVYLDKQTMQIESITGELIPNDVYKENYKLGTIMG